MKYKTYTKGAKVETLYGVGFLESSRPDEDGCCVIQLSYGTLYASPLCPIRRILTAEELNAIFENLESIRKLNLEIECNELGIPVDFDKCTLCLLSSAHKTTDDKKRSTGSILLHHPFGGRSRLKNVPGYGKMARIAKAANPIYGNKNVMARCLVCAAPTCSEHASKSFAKEKVTFCLPCEALFSMKLDKNSDPETLQTQVDRLTSAYDRGFVLLQYMCQFVSPLVEQLNAEEATDNEVALGTSTVSFLAGAMGFAGVALIWTPAGAPLLCASLCFGSTGTVVGLGYSAKKYLQAGPNEVANRIIAIHGLLQSILITLVVFREELRHDPKPGSSTTFKFETRGRNQYLEALSQRVSDGLSQGTTATNIVNIGFQIGNAAGRSEAATIFQYLGMAPGIGVAFSAAMMVVDLHTAATTLEKMRTGSKSEKAQTLVEINSSLLVLPTSDDVDADVQDTIEAMESTV